MRPRFRSGLEPRIYCNACLNVTRYNEVTRDHDSGATEREKKVPTIIAGARVSWASRKTRTKRKKRGKPKGAEVVVEAAERARPYLLPVTCITRTCAAFVPRRDKWCMIWRWLMGSWVKVISGAPGASAHLTAELKVSNTGAPLPCNTPSTLTPFSLLFLRIDSDHAWLREFWVSVMERRLVQK